MNDGTDRDARLRRFQKWTEFPLLGLVGISILLDSLLQGDAFWWTDKGIRAVFLADWITRFCLTPREKLKKFIFSVWTLIDLSAVFLPSARTFRVLRIVRSVALLFRFAHRLRALVVNRGANLLIVPTSACLLIAVLMFLVERGEGGSITSLADALWWAVTTVTTVGYGDTHPVTLGGKGVAVLAMVVGVGTFGLLTAHLASWLVQLGGQEAQTDEVKHLVVIRKELDEIKQLIVIHHPGSPILSVKPESRPVNENPREEAP